ncbi:MAG: HAD hydrolase-like protein [Erysipelotrichaceae bacterium]|nr:HAD hydrolase-like protein [Erysipelotrichaceae bacterium]
MKYKCLVFDHDDTTVNSTATIHYPSFIEYMRIKHPEISYTLEDYFRYNFDPGVIPFFKDMCGLSEEELKEEQEFWFEYAKNHVADAFDGIRDIMNNHKDRGGIIAVVSHSYSSNILKDYRYNDLPEPDIIFGWEQPKEERKPSPVPLYKIMETYNLKPEDLLMIDDLKPGLVMARAAGVDFAAAGWCNFVDENELYMRQHADYYCKEVEDLKKIVW